MATHKLLLLPGDGIGPEVMGEVKRLIDWLNSAGIAKFETDPGWSAAPPMTPQGKSISEGDMAKAMAADAMIFGAVGGPKWDAFPTRCGPRPACCGCARISACSPTSARPCVIRRWRTPPA